MVTLGELKALLQVISEEVLHNSSPYHLTADNKKDFIEVINTLKYLTDHIIFI